MLTATSSPTPKKANVPMRSPISQPPTVSRKATESGKAQAKMASTTMRLSIQRRSRMPRIGRQPTPLGAGNRFTADRINRLLLAGYGRQDVRVDIEGVDAARVFEAEKMGPDVFWPLAKSDIDFLLVDRRLSTAPPVLGFYFEPWEARDGKPLSPAALLKFNHVDGITRIYDNGFIVIYDVRGLHGRS